MNNLFLSAVLHFTRNAPTNLPEAPNHPIWEQILGLSLYVLLIFLLFFVRVSFKIEKKHHR